MIDCFQVYRTNQGNIDIKEITIKKATRNTITGLLVLGYFIATTLGSSNELEFPRFVMENHVFKIEQPQEHQSARPDIWLSRRYLVPDKLFKFSPHRLLGYNVIPHYMAFHTNHVAAENYIPKSLSHYRSRPRDPPLS